MPKNSLSENRSLNKNPIVQFQRWFEDAVQTGMKYPDAMTLATASASGSPSARIVLYKGINKVGEEEKKEKEKESRRGKGNEKGKVKKIDEEGLTFFTNYQSNKGKALLANPRAALLFYWPELNRQLRIEGRIQLLSSSESDEYWETRPRESQINSMASPQSRKISGRAVLIKKVKELNQKYPSTGDPCDVPRPQHWGGFCLIPNKFEFWIEGKFRLHDRFQYLKKNGKWEQARLAP